MNTTTYEVISSFAVISSKPTLFSSILGFASKGNKIEVISVSNGWTFFYYNSRSAYIRLSSLQLVPTIVTGSVTIKYIDEISLLEISYPTLYTNQVFNSYTYNSKSISGYTVSGSPSQTITLSATNPNQTITFKYKKILGSVTVKYVDETSLLDVRNQEIINNLSLGSYTYNSIIITGYSLSSASSQTVTLTDSNPNQTITFKYKKILGSVTIKYVDESSLLDVNNPVVTGNLSLGSYTYNSILISGYSLSSPTTQTVTLTDSDPNQIITFKYREILGSVTIKYIDESSLLDISNAVVTSNLNLGSYTYNSIVIAGYSISGSTSQTVTLTDATPNQTIIFRYKKLLGSVTVKYIHVASKNELTVANYYTNLDLKSYTYIAKDIPCYDVFGESSKTVILTESAPNQVITFEYKTIRLPLNPDKQNEVPYISTYYMKPVIGPNEEVIIDYYITDYYHNEYINEDYSSNLTVTVKIDGKPDIILPDLKAGDHSVNLGNFSTLGEQKFSILCTDQYGRNSHELFNFFLIKGVVNINEYVMSTNDLAYYKIDNTNNKTNVTSTREGLQKLLDDKKSQGYNKLILLSGIYRIDHLATIYIPTQFTLDMNGATLKLNGFTGAKALMLDINNTFDSHVVNGTIEGDYFEHDYTNSPNNSEWVNGVSIGGESKYSSYENIIIKDITGYGSTNGIANSRDGSLGYTYFYPTEIGDNFKLGDIDRSNGNSIPSINRTTCDFQDISGYSDIGYLSVSIYLGYQGNPCGTWNLICHYYDINKNFIKSIDAYQYRRIAVPSNAKFMKVTILNESYPSNLSIQLFRIPTNCNFSNIKHENCRAVGMAPNAMNNMLINSCEFTNSGQALAKCAFDAEDGWDMMQDVTFKALNFYNNPYNEFLTCAGHNFIVDGQISGNIYIWERTRSLVIKNCNDVSINLESGGKENIVKHGVYRVYNNNFTVGSVANNLSKSNRCIGALGGLISNSTLGGIVDNSVYNNCTISIGSSFFGYISKISMINCNFIPIATLTDRYELSFNGGNLNSIYFENCKFIGKSTLSNHNRFYCGNFVGCTFEDTNVSPNVNANSDDIISFSNCTLGYSANNFITYSPYAYSKGTFTNIKFDNCKINNIDNNTNSFVYAYAKPNGTCTFTNCTLTIPQSIIIFDGYPENIDYITGYSLQFINSTLPSNIQLISPAYKSNPNIKVSIS